MRTGCRAGLWGSLGDSVPGVIPEHSRSLTFYRSSVLRVPTADEFATLKFLISGASTAHDALTAQLASVMVEPVATDPISLRLIVAADAPSASIPEALAASGFDENGTEVSVLLHVRSGYISELEFYAPNGEPTYGRPDVNSLGRMDSIEWPQQSHGDSLM